MKRKKNMEGERWSQPHIWILCEGVWRRNNAAFSRKVCFSSAVLAWVMCTHRLHCCSALFLPFFWLNADKNVRRTFWARWRWDAVSVTRPKQNYFPLVFFSSYARTLLNRLYVSSFATKGNSLTNYSSFRPWLLFRKSVLNFCSLTSIYESFICHSQVVQLTQSKRGTPSRGTQTSLKSGHMRI